MIAPLRSPIEPESPRADSPRWQRARRTAFELLEQNTQRQRESSRTAAWRAWVVTAWLVFVAVAYGARLLLWWS